MGDFQGHPPGYEPPAVPAYGVPRQPEESPAYELDDLSSSAPPAVPPPRPSIPVLASYSTFVQTSHLDEATIDSCAPKLGPKERWWTRLPTKTKVLLLALLLLPLTGLVAGLAYFGVHTAEVRNAENFVKRNPAEPFVKIARETWDPKVTSLVFSDTPILQLFNFSYPSASSYLVHSTNYTLLTSSHSEAFHFPITNYRRLQDFGSRSTKITFVPTTRENETDLVVDVDAIWRVADGWSEDEAREWGMNELGMVSGGMFGTNFTIPSTATVRGITLDSTNNELDASVFQPSLTQGSIFQDLDKWNSTIVFNITVFVPLSPSDSYLQVYGGNMTSVDFSLGAQNVSSFGHVDVRLKNGSISSSGLQVGYNLSLFSPQGISGFYSIRQEASFLSHSAMVVQLALLPQTAYQVANNHPTHNVSLITTSGSVSPLYPSGPITFNLTSYPPDANFTLTAIAVNGSVWGTFIQPFNDSFAYDYAWDARTNGGGDARLTFYGGQSGYALDPYPWVGVETNEGGYVSANRSDLSQRAKGKGKMWVMSGEGDVRVDLDD